MRAPKYDAAIIDLDGTMVDTVSDFEHALGATFAELGLPGLGRAFIALTVGKGSEHLVKKSLAQVGGDANLYERAWDRYQHHYQRFNGLYSTVYPGVEAGLNLLRERGLRLACLTNKPSAFAQTLLREKNLINWFDNVFGGDAFARKKPDPLPLLKTCEALHALPARVLMVGDSSNDAQAARAAGCPVVLVSYGYNHGEPVAQAGADAVIDSLALLGPLLDSKP